MPFIYPKLSHLNFQGWLLTLLLMSCWSSSIFTFPGTWEVFFSIPNFPLLYLDTAATMTLNCLSKDLSLYENLTVFSFSSQDSLYPQSVQLLSRVWLCDPMNRSTPGLPVHHQLPEFTQTHVHRVGDAIQPSHPVVPFSFCPQSLPALDLATWKQLRGKLCDQPFYNG